MNKEDFLNRLKSKLSILDNDEVSDILSEYSEHIDEKVKDGSSEEDAIKEFGNIDELARDILSAYKINGDYSQNKFDSFIESIVNTTKEVFNKIVKILFHSTVKDIIKLVLYLVILILIVWLLRIPFELLNSLLNNIFDILPGVLRDAFDIIISLVINISYIVISFLFVIKMLKERMLGEYVEEEIIIESTKKNKIKNSKKENVIKKETIYKNNKTFIDSIIDLIMFILRIIALFVIIPGVIGIIFSAVGLSYLILFSINYYAFIGPIIICLGLLCGSIWFTDILYRFIAKKNGSFLKSFISFIVALVLCGIGIGVSILEITNIDVEEYSTPLSLIDTYEYNTDEIHAVSCFNCITVEKVVDNTMSDNEFIVNLYGNEFQETIEELYYSDNQRVSYYYRNDDYKVFKKILENLKLGKIYDYTINDNVKIEVIGNENTLNRINTDNNWD